MEQIPQEQQEQTPPNAPKGQRFGPLFHVTAMTLGLVVGVLVVLKLLGHNSLLGYSLKPLSKQFFLIMGAATALFAYGSSLLYWAAGGKIRPLDALLFMPLGVMGFSALTLAFGTAAWLSIEAMVGESNLVISLAVGALGVYVFYTLMVD